MKNILILTLCAFCLSCIGVEAKTSDHFTIEKTTDMKYINEAQFSQMITDTDLSDLTDNLEGAPRTAILEEVNFHAAAEIDGYLTGRYDISGSPSDNLLRTLCSTIMKYKLYERRDGLNLPDNAIKFYQIALKQLEGIANGKIRVSLSPPEVTNPENTSGSRIMIAQRPRSTRYDI